MTYLDTHTLLWLYFGEKAKLSAAAKEAIEADELRVSPMVLLEVAFLREIRRMDVDPDIVAAEMQLELGVALCPIPFHRVARTAYLESWTRDPFDRLIVAHAKAGGGRLLTKDARILDHCEIAFW